MPRKSPEQHPYPVPYSEEAESAVIGSIIIEPGWLEELDLDPDDFFLDTCRRLYEACLALRERGEHVDEQSVSKEASPAVPVWEVPRILSQMPTHMDCAYHARTVRELSQKRKLIDIGERLVKMAKDPATTAQRATDEVRTMIEGLAFPGKSSRFVAFSNPRIFTSEPPSYIITVSSTNDKKAVDIRFTSAELDNTTAFKRKIREKLGVNPVLPKPFDTLIHNLVKQAKSQLAPKDASAEEQICILIRDWFKTAMEAEHVDDLAQGYVEKEGAYWFSSTKILKYLSDKAKVKMTPEKLWPILASRGGRKSKVHRLGDNTARLWGLDKKFFEAEKEEPIEGEQIPLAKKEEDDLSWLE